MEFAIPKTIVNAVTEPALIKFLKAFYPELYKKEEKKEDGVPASLESISQKILPDCYYSFAHRRLYAKLRKTAYFAPEADRLYR